MALEDLIVQSGGQMARAIPEGLERGRQAAMNEQANTLRMQVSNAMLQKTQMDLAKMKTDQEREEYDRKLQDFSYGINGGWEVFNSIPDKRQAVGELRKYLEMNKEKLLAAGDDEADKALEGMLKMDDRRLITTYNAVHKSLPMVQDFLTKSRSTSRGSSEFERLEALGENRSRGEQSRWELMSGLKTRPSSGTVDVSGYIHTRDPETGDLVNTGKKSGAQRRAEETILEKQSGRTAARTDKYHKEASDAIGYYSSIGENIDKAIAAMESGDINLVDQLATQAVTQANDTNVRAVQMYKEFDKNYGAAYERIYRGVGQWVMGKRTEAEMEDMKEALLEFKRAYADPAKERFKAKYRGIAKANGLDPFLVVPPDTKYEIKNSDLPIEKKLEYLKIYVPHEFKK